MKLILHYDTDSRNSSLKLEALQVDVSLNKDNDVVIDGSNYLNDFLQKYNGRTLIINLKDEKERNLLLAKKVLNIISNYPFLNILLESVSEIIANYIKSNSSYKVGTILDHSNYSSNEYDFYTLAQDLVTKEIIDDKLSNDKDIIVSNLNSSNDLLELKKMVGDRVNHLYFLK